MSRVGKKPIPIPDQTKLLYQDGVLTVQGKKGTLSRSIHASIGLKIEDAVVEVTMNTDDRKSRALQGLTRSLVANMITGVTRGFERRLEIQGIGYRAEIQGNMLRLTLGFSHPILFPLPEGIKVEVEKQTNIKVEGIDKQLVGSVAAQIRSLKPPEPYKGKGIRYANEYVKLKVGKAKA